MTITWVPGFPAWVRYRGRRQADQGRVGPSLVDESLRRGRRRHQFGAAGGQANRERERLRRCGIPREPAFLIGGRVPFWAGLFWPKILDTHARAGDGLSPGINDASFEQLVEQIDIDAAELLLQVLR